MTFARLGKGRVPVIIYPIWSTCLKCQSKSSPNQRSWSVLSGCPIQWHNLMKYFHDNNIQVTQLLIWILSNKRPSPALSSMDALLLFTSSSTEIWRLSETSTEINYSNYRVKEKRYWKWYQWFNYEWRDKQKWH